MEPILLFRVYYSLKFLNIAVLRAAKLERLSHCNLLCFCLALSVCKLLSVYQAANYCCRCCLKVIIESMHQNIYFEPGFEYKPIIYMSH